MRMGLVLANLLPGACEIELGSVLMMSASVDPAALSDAGIMAWIEHSAKVNWTTTAVGNFSQMRLPVIGTAGIVRSRNGSSSGSSVQPTVQLPAYSLTTIFLTGPAKDYIYR